MGEDEKKAQEEHHKGVTPGAQLQLVLGRLKRARRGIILFHDTRPQTVAMLPDFLAALQQGGYRVVHIVPA